MTSQELVSKGQSYLAAKYPGYAVMSGRERRVLAAAWLNDLVKPREKTGNNDGEVVEAILQSCGLGKGNPWCAAAQTTVALVARVGKPIHNPASVREWRLWAKHDRYIPVKSVQRGDLVTKDYHKGKGHIGIVVKRFGIWVTSIEGNTADGDTGSQREGQGMYRRTRLISFWSDAIRGD